MKSLGPQEKRNSGILNFLKDAVKQLPSMTKEESFSFIDSLRLRDKNTFLIEALKTKDLKYINPYIDYLVEKGWLRIPVDFSSGVLLPNGLLIPVGKISAHRLPMENYMNLEPNTIEYEVLFEKFLKQKGITFVENMILVSSTYSFSYMQKNIQTVIDYLLASNQYKPFLNKDIIIIFGDTEYTIPINKLRKNPVSLSFGKRKKLK